MDGKQREPSSSGAARHENVEKAEKAAKVETDAMVETDAKAEKGDRVKGVPATFTGDIGGTGATAGEDLGRGGTTTATGDISGGGEPGSVVDFGDGSVSDRDAVPTGGAGTAVGGQPAQQPHGENARLPEPARDLPRTATTMTPGIPVGSGRGIDEALRQPDSEIGGGVAGDTTAAGGGETSTGEERGQGREPKNVRSEDKDRTTL